MLCVRCKKDVPDGRYCNECGWEQAKKKPKRAKKRANGMGSVYKVAGRKKPWIGYVTLPGDKNSSVPPERVYTDYRATRAEVEADIVAMMPKVTVLYNVTFSQVFKALSSEPEYMKLSERQKQQFEKFYRVDFNHLHERKFRSLKTTDFQGPVTKVREEGGSASKQKKMKSLISKMCDWAMPNDIIDKNYGSFISTDLAEAAEKRIFTDEHIALFYKNRDKRAAQIVLAMIGSGMRINELAKVLKDDNLRLNEGYIINGSKTDAGKDRIIPIIPFVLPIFKECALAAEPGGPLFRNATGTGPLHANNFRKRDFYPLLDELGIQKNPYNYNGKRVTEDEIEFTPHSCRHTWASLGDRAGIQKDDLQLAAGHVVGSDITDKVYIHKKEDVEAQRLGKEFAKLDKLLAGVVEA